MRHLLDIERQFLTSAQVSAHVNFGEVDSLLTKATAKSKEAFDVQVELAKIVYRASVWLKSAETQAQLDEAGIVFQNFEELGKRVFNYGKAQAYKMKKAGAIAIEQEEMVNRFKTICDEREEAGDTAGRGIDNLIAFVANDGREEKETNERTLFTLSIAKDGLNGEKGISARITINENGGVSSKISGEADKLTDLEAVKIMELIELFKTKAMSL